jgi:hypothetical protein
VRIYIVTYQGGLPELYDVDSEWHLDLFAQDYNHADYNNWEHLSNGSFLNPSCEVQNSLLRRCFFYILILTVSLRELTGYSLTFILTSTAISDSPVLLFWSPILGCHAYNWCCWRVKRIYGSTFNLLLPSNDGIPSNTSQYAHKRLVGKPK